jgi:hypothetical protein
VKKLLNTKCVFWISLQHLSQTFFILRRIKRDMIINGYWSSCKEWFLPYFSKLSHKRHDFREKVIEHKMCVLNFSTNLSETFFILRRIKRDVIINGYWSSCKEWFLPYFSKLSHKRHDFRNKVIEQKMRRFIFSTTFVWNISHSKKNPARYCHICTQVFMQNTYSCQMLMASEFSRFSKNINFLEPCILYIGRVYCYPPDVAFHIFFFNTYK